MNVLDFDKYKSEGKKISMVTCYDYWSACLVEESDMDCVLVGDSLAMVMHGFDSTVQADIDMMSLHTRAVRRGYSGFIISDIPFLANRKGLETFMSSVEMLMKAGANAVKIEGSDGNLDYIKHCTESGVPVMGHLGLTPQSVHQLGGYKVQGRNDAARKKLIQSALDLEAAGCFSLVFECIPHDLAEEISGKLHIPVIGIGAGAEVDGQVLVFHDLLGLSSGHYAKFVRKFAEGSRVIVKGLNDYHKEVVEHSFPSEKERYS